VSISRARAIAFDILRRVEGEGAYASDLLHAELGWFSERARSLPALRTSPKQIKPEDAALATELTLGVLRWQRLLDFLLERQLKKPGAKLDLPVALALRLGLYQLRFLERIPPRAAINESVELVKRARKASAASLVNAVLRRSAEDLAAQGRQSLGGRSFNSDKKRTPSPRDSAPEADRVIVSAERLLPSNLPRAERLAILYSHPTWLVERWLARFGEQRTLALLDANNRPPRLSCTLHDAEHRDQIVASLAKAGLRLEPGALLKNALAVTGGSVVRTDAFLRGTISIQDEASQAIPLLLGVQPGDRVLDLCAAPGGKTPSLIRAAGEAGLVIAGDRHAHRLRAMRKHFERLNIASRFPGGGLQAGRSRVAIIRLDAAQPLPFRAKFDRILVDAPCSGTGTLARHPEIRWRLRPDRLAEFHQLQVEILTSALGALAPGGRLVYSTCSLEPEENETVIFEVLGRPPENRSRDGAALGTPTQEGQPRDKDRNYTKGFSPAMAPAEIGPVIAPHLVPQNRLAHEIAPHLTPGVDAASLFDASGYFYTIPGTHPTDNFFAAVLETSRS
jgi:16S rRNA (cytosine967-C5)-methyltransferase